MKDDIFDVIVVGSGVGGLAAATAASKAKAKTLILEAMPFVGGYINPYTVKGYSFDTGLHYLGELGENGSFRKRLEKLGIWEMVDFIEINPDCIGKYHFNGKVFCLPKGIDNFKKRLFTMFPDEKNAVEALIGLLKDIQKASSIGAKGPKNPEFAKYMPFFMKLMKKSYGQLIDEITNNQELKYIFSIMSGEAGLPPDRASAFTALILLHYLEGGYYPKGGSGALRDAFINAIKENGGIIKTSHRVIKICKSSGLFKVLTEKGEFSSKNVISDVDPQLTFTQLLDEKINIESLKKKALKLQPSIGSFYAFLVTDLNLEQLGFGDFNLIHTDTLDLNEAFDEWDEFKNFFLTVPTLKDKNCACAPKNYHTIEVISMAPFEPFQKWANKPPRQRGDDYLKLKLSLGDRLLTKVEKYIPNLRKHLIFKDFATPLSNLFWVNAPFGGDYGPNQTPSQMGPGRFPIKTKVEGLYLCGAGTLAGGISPSIASGDIAASLALKES